MLKAVKNLYLYYKFNLRALILFTKVFSKLILQSIFHLEMQKLSLPSNWLYMQLKYGSV